MKAVLKCRLSSGEVIEVDAYMFKWIDFDGAEIISGDAYFVAKAVKLGAKKVVKPRKAK